MEEKKKNCVCESCRVEADCAWNDWCLFDSSNPDCPNYEEGMKFLEECKDL